MTIPQQSSWMVRKILGARDIVNQMHEHVIEKKSLIKQIYIQLLAVLPEKLDVP